MRSSKLDADVGVFVGRASIPLSVSLPHKSEKGHIGVVGSREVSGRDASSNGVQGGSDREPVLLLTRGRHGVFLCRGRGVWFHQYPRVSGTNS